MTKILAIDPGSTYYGLAYFNGGELTHAYYMPGKGPTPWRAWDNIDLVLVESMQTYHRDGGRNAQALMDVQFAAGRITANVPEDRLRRVLPREWTANVPARIQEMRTLKILSASEAHLITTIKSQRSHVLSAIGIGLWFLGRKYNGNTLG
jgi:hypothetical protein